MADQQRHDGLVHTTADADEHYNPLALVGVVVLALVLFAALFLSFLVAPLAVLVLFYVGFAVAGRGRRGGG
ncbi:hypothetical protein [Conexibacter sp. SYSU D00693]|uniref:hypothetical protein n=1 Tax=Conexibacter sp. SYSU D00693 TaxID=2812560 RepID=UPI00196AF774|nr:hypothetical protein [Conexibacter sp. SYSU D00693]